MESLPISAVIVSHNEGNLLSRCLPSVLFCREVIVVDLDSTDNTEAVTRGHGAVYMKHQRVPVVEIIHTWIKDRTAYDWILKIDPDEVVSDGLRQNIRDLFPNISEATGSITVPWIFYYKSRPLAGTTWGGVNEKCLLVNRQRFRFTPHVHRGGQLRDGYQDRKIAYTGENCLHHYWMNSFTQLLEKHWRYLKAEGVSRAANQPRLWSLRTITTPAREFRHSFIRKKGYKDGWTGFSLSLFWACYETAARVTAWVYLRRQGQNDYHNY